MKYYKNILTILLLVITTSCYSQHLVKTVSDAPKIKANEKTFIGQPLKDLLKEIKPQIKMAYGDPSTNINSQVGYFRFTFVDQKQKNNLKLKGKTPVTIIVYVKEYFDWDFKTRPKGNEYTWTKEDEKKYGNLTVVGFRVYGEPVEN